MRFIVVVAFLLIQVQLFSQQWVRTYYSNNNAYTNCIIETCDHGYLIDAWLNIGNNNFIRLLKTDINGNTLWEKQIGLGSNIFYSVEIEQTIDGGYILCGSTTKYSDSYDAFIMKLNACAEIEWCKVLITPGNYDISIKVGVTPEGDYIMLGNYFETNPASRTSLFKFNSYGDLIWHQFYPLDSLYYQDEAQDLMVDNDGYLVTSFRYCPDSGTSSPKIMRSYFMKTDTAGVKDWDLVYGVNNHFYAWPWCTTKNSTGNYFHSCTHSSLSGENPALIKVSHDGSLSDDHDIIATNNINFCGMPAITILNDTNLILFGGYMVNNVFTDHVLKTDTNGNLISSNLLTTTSNSYISAVKTFDDKFVAVANDASGGDFHIVAVKVNSGLEYDSIYNQHFTYDSLCSYPIVSDTIDPNCENIYVNIDEPFKKPETTKLKVYPNPTNNKVTIELPKYLVVTDNSGQIPTVTVYHQWTQATLQILDIKGVTLLQQEVNNSHNPALIDVSQLRSGMYLFRLVCQGLVVGDCKVLVK